MHLLINAVKGFIIGSLMLLPGISGGSSAMILGVYDDLLASVATFTKRFKKNILFIGSISLGALLGIFLLAKPLIMLYTAYPFLLGYLFSGFVLGGCILHFLSSGIKINIKTICWLMLGILCCIAISALPKNIFIISDAKSISNLVKIIAIGLVLSVALVLPGISFSYMLLVFGMYDYILKAIASFDLLVLAIFGFSILLGIFTSSVFLSKMIKKYPQPLNSFIIGFVLYSLGQIIPPFEVSGRQISGLMLMLLATVIIISSSYILRKKSSIRVIPQ